MVPSTPKQREEMERISRALGQRMFQIQNNSRAADTASLVGAAAGNPLAALASATRAPR